MDELAALIRPERDVIQAWPIGGGTASVLVRGNARPVSLASVIVASGRPLLVPTIDRFAPKDPDQPKELP
jgi:hypothetical protein